MGSTFCLHAPLTVGAYEDAEVVDADGLQRVELTAQPLAVAALSLAAEDGSVPQVGAYIIIWFTVAYKVAVLDADELLG